MIDRVRKKDTPAAMQMLQLFSGVATRAHCHNSDCPRPLTTLLVGAQIGGAEWLTFCYLIPFEISTRLVCVATFLLYFGCSYSHMSPLLIFKVYFLEQRPHFLVKFILLFIIIVIYLLLLLNVF